VRATEGQALRADRSSSTAWKPRCRTIRPTYRADRRENAYRISVAVAGFTDADLSIDTNENRLAIRGEKQANDGEKTRDVLYQGIAARTFERSFQLADHVEVQGASLENGRAPTRRPRARNSGGDEAVGRSRSQVPAGSWR